MFRRCLRGSEKSLLLLGLAAHVHNVNKSPSWRGEDAARGVGTEHEREDVRCAEVSTILETQFNNDAHIMDWNEANNCAGVSAKVCWNDEAPTGVVQSDGGKTSLYRTRCANNETQMRYDTIMRTSVRP